MSRGNSKNSIIGSMFWRFSERVSNQLVSFVISVVLARLLLPEEYGLVAMIDLFIVFANVFVTSGFTSALIQKKDADDLDFTTIFYCTLLTSLLLYAILFLSAPLIAQFFGMPDLCLLTRVYSLSLILTSYQTVQQAYVHRNMIFKKSFIPTLVGTLFSGILGIYLAYEGYGVWALVAQYISNIVFNMFTLMVVVDWKPSLSFSFDRAKNLMNFGSKILLSTIISVFYKEIRQLLIGKFYSPIDLAMYNRGAHIPKLITTNLDNTISSVLFPAMSNYSDDKTRVRQLLRRSLKTTSYVTFFFLSLVAVASKPLIGVLLTDKWLPCVPYMQILCFSNMIVTLSGANLQALKAIGKSDEVLKLEVLKKPVFLLLVFLSVKISVLAVVLTLPINAIYALYMNMGPTKRHLDYSRKDQILDLIPSFLLSLAMVSVTLPLTLLPWNEFVIMFFQVLIGIITYVGLSIICKVESYEYCKNTFLNMIAKRKLK